MIEGEEVCVLEDIDHQVEEVGFHHFTFIILTTELFVITEEPLFSDWAYPWRDGLGRQNGPY